MKSTELRIGNFVGRNLKELPENFFRVLERDRNNHYFDIDVMEPIPLTEEWLRRFGFANITKDSDINVHYELKVDGWSIEYEIAKGYFECFLEGIRLDKSDVHSLQNLYFVICGKELELKHK